MNTALKSKLGYAIAFPDDHVIFDPAKRHDFVFLFDATRCNPNGDPDNDNMPRQDLETRVGLVTSGALKRKLRDFMAEVYGTARTNDESGRMNLYVKHKGLLKNEHQAVRAKFGKGTTEQNQKNMRAFYWDVRLFGGVLAVGKEDVAETEPLDGLVDAGSPAETPAPEKDKGTGKVKKEDVLNGGQCVGCVSIDMAETVEVVTPGLMSIVRTARVDNPADAEDQDVAVSSMPGNSAILPYGLYRGSGQYFSTLDRFGQVTREDLAVLWNGLRQMFQFSVSDARPAGSMKSLGAWVFSHDHKLGNYPVHKLLQLIQPRRTEQSTATELPARGYLDYLVDLAWDDADTSWGVENGRLTREGRDIGVAVTELYNDWRD